MKLVVLDGVIVLIIFLYRTAQRDGNHQSMIYWFLDDTFYNEMFYQLHVLLCMIIFKYAKTCTYGAWPI
jgi:hypothetical protein